jgi:hypothetical protein
MKAARLKRPKATAAETFVAYVAFVAPQLVEEKEVRGLG